MKEALFFNNYFLTLNQLTSFNQLTINKLIKVKKLLLSQKKNNKKILIFGNGGSSAIASHFSVDLTKNAKIRCSNYNEPDLITCFSNDFGYDKWIEKAVDFYGDSQDIIILISSSGKSKNMLNGCKAARKKKFKSIITLTGFNGKNPLFKQGDINFSVNSKAYNHIENTHQVLLLALVDSIIGKTEYSVR